MAHTLSANKRIRQSAKRRARNRDRKKLVRVELKKLHAVLATADKSGSEAEFKKAVKVLDRVAGRGTIHPNTAARRKSKLARKLNALKAGAAKA